MRVGDVYEFRRQNIDALPITQQVADQKLDRGVVMVWFVGCEMPATLEPQGFSYLNSNEFRLVKAGDGPEVQ